MPEFAQFVALQGTDDAFRATVIPFDFDLPNLDTARTVVLMFKVSGPSGARLWMTFVEDSASPSVDFELDATFTRPRTWHEIVERDVLKEAGNTLLVGGVPTEAGVSAAVSDIVVLYHARTP